MEKITAFMMMVAAGFSTMTVQAKNPQVPANRVVTVRVNNNIRTPPHILIPAQGVASQVLAQAGIRLVWRNTSNTVPTMPIGSCGERRLQTIDITFVDKAPKDQPYFAMAIAHPFSGGGVRIVVFWDRVQSVHQDVDPSTIRIVLGHILAHEIGHILIGKNEHSPSGLMKARFSGGDKGRMRRAPLPINPTDIGVMQNNLDNPRSCTFVAAEQ